MKFILATILAGLSFNAAAQGYSNVQVIDIPFLNNGNHTILNQPYILPAQGTVVSRIIKMKAGDKVLPHGHAVPMFSTIIKGKLKIDYGNEGYKIYKANTGYVEAIETCHQAVALEDTELHVLMIVPYGQENLTKVTHCKME